MNLDLVRRHRFALAVFGCCQVVLFVWWLAFFPVLVSPDSITYVYEATTNHWATDHSVVYDAVIWLSLQATHGVAVLTFLQTVAFAAALAYIATGLVRMGARPWFAAVAPVVAVLSPGLGSFPVYLWKDVPFTLAWLWLLGLLIRVVDLAREEPQWWTTPRARRLVAWSFVAVLLGCLTRNNAFVFAVITAVLLLIVWRRAGLRLAAGVVLGAVVATVLTAAVFPLFGVQRAKSDLVLGPAYDDIAYVYEKDPHTFSAKDLALLQTVAPLKLWHDAGNCYTSDDLTNSHKFSRDQASKHAGKLFALWRRLLVDHPIALTKARLCRGFIAWSPIAGPPGRGHTVFPITSEKKSRFEKVPNPTWRRALKPAPVSTEFRSLAQRYVVHSRDYEDVLWRGATWAYVLYIAIGVAIWRSRRWALLALATLPLGLQIGVLLDNPNQLVRYLMFPLYAGVALLPLVTLRRVEPAVPSAVAAEPPAEPAPLPETPPQDQPDPGPPPA